jgi:hypothetical protein
MKLYEYLAAGLRVIGPVGAIRGLDGSADIYWAGSAAQAAEKIRSAPNTTIRPAPELPPEHDWSAKAALLEQFVDEVMKLVREKRTRSASESGGSLDER